MAQNNPFSYTTWLQARQALALRLNDSGHVFWTDTEIGLYIKEALRVWNCLTQFWIQDYTGILDSTNLVWQSLGSDANAFVGSNPLSPRYPTLTDAYCYTMAQYHLLEPPTGAAAWTGTTQFTVADFTQSFQRRRDYILQNTGCNVGPFSNTFSLTPGESRVYLPDTISQSILDIRRVRFLPATNQGDPSTLYREDGLAMEYFEPNFTTESDSVPFAWDQLAGPPLALTFDSPAPVPNTLDILAMISGGEVVAPFPAPLLIPDDWYWVLKFGMMADMLRKESESTDLQRADYCEKRFQEGVQLMNEMPWLLQARINNLPVDTPSVGEMDDFAYEWQSDAFAPVSVVRGGIDLVAISPNLATGVGFGDGGFGDGGFGGNTNLPISVSLSLVGNAPMPVADDDFLQIPRDVLDTILDEAQHLAAFKHGGFEFAESIRTLHSSFIQSAMLTNRRLAESGIFTTDLRPVGASRQDAIDPRFALQGS